MRSLMSLTSHDSEAVIRLVVTDQQLDQTDDLAEGTSDISKDALTRPDQLAALESKLQEAMQAWNQKTGSRKKVTLVIGGGNEALESYTVGSED